MVENLGNKDKSIQSDCIKVLYEIGYIKPILISNYVNEFTKLLTAFSDKIDIFNIARQLVGKLLNENRESGTYIVNWDASNLSSGLYFIRLKSEKFIKSRSCLLVK